MDDKTYAEMAAKAYKSGVGEDLTQTFIAWDEEGKIVSGCYLYSETVTAKADMGAVKRYVLLTDEGTASCILGGATDKQLEGKLIPGDMITIVYKGKTSIQGGSKQVNNFDVRRWGHDASYDKKS